MEKNDFQRWFEITSKIVGDYIMFNLSYFILRRYVPLRYLPKKVNSKIKNPFLRNNNEMQYKTMLHIYSVKRSYFETKRK